MSYNCESVINVSFAIEPRRIVRVNPYGCACRTRAQCQVPCTQHQYTHEEFPRAAEVFSHGQSRLLSLVYCAGMMNAREAPDTTPVPWLSPRPREFSRSTLATDSQVAADVTLAIGNPTCHSKLHVF